MTDFSAQIRIPESVDDFVEQLKALMQKRCSAFSVVNIYALQHTDFTHTIEIERNAVGSFRSITIEFNPDDDDIVVISLTSTNNDDKHKYVVTKLNYVTRIKNIGDQLLSILDIEFASKIHTKYRCAALQKQIDELSHTVEEQHKRIQELTNTVQDLQRHIV